MKNQILKAAFVIMALLTISNIHAEKLSKKAQEIVKKEVAEMTEVMDLNQEQQAKMIELKTSLRISNKQVAKEYAKGSQELKDARKVNMQHYMTEMKQVCSKTQFKKWQKHKKAMKNKN